MKSGGVMKISKNGQYALISVVDLTLQEKGRHVSIPDIAQRQNIDQRHLAQIFFKLKNAGILAASRGKNGGYYLSRPPSQITAGDVIRAVEGGLNIAPCNDAQEGALACGGYENCMTRTLWQNITHEINQTLDSTTIADIAADFSKRLC